MADDNKGLTGLAKVNAERKAAKAKKDAAGVGETPAPSAPETSTTVPDPKTPEAPPAGDPVGSTPSPEFRGNGAADIVGSPAPAETAPGDSEDETDPRVKLAKEYAKLYPKNDVFYITSDMQVFLADGERTAKFHQRGVAGEVKKYIIKRD